MRRLAVDTWAFLEVYLDGPRNAEVQRLMMDGEDLFTVRDVVAETCNFIIRRERRLDGARAWLAALGESPVRVEEPPWEDVRDFLLERRGRGALSFTDHALAHAALRERAKDVLTGDAEFRTLGLNPLFARR